MVRDSIILTVSDREPELLLNTIRWLRLSNLDDTEIIIVDDGSRIDYAFMGQILDQCNARMVRMDPYEAYRLDETFNNPAKAFNRGLQEAVGERLIILSSDVLVPPNVMERCRRYDVNDVIYCPMVIDLATAAEYCGPRRVFPMPWFLACSREHAVKAGGWDENYLQGMCWEDNDFVGRLALTTGKILFDFSSIVWHQSHHQPAYLNEPDTLAANRRNKDYTFDKWMSIPFGDTDRIAFEAFRKIHETGNVLFEYKDFRDILPKAIAATNSPFVKVPV